MTDTVSNPQPGAGSPGSAHTEEIKSAARDAGQAAMSALDQARSRLGDQGTEKVDSASTTAGESLRMVAEQLRQAGENLGQEQGWARDAFSKGAEGLDRVSGYLRVGRAADFSRDLHDFARTNPAAFLAGSVAVGFFAARVARTAVEQAAPSSPPPAAEPQSDPTTTWQEPRSFAPEFDDAVEAPQGGAF
jgi:hypothetical protein